MVYCADMSMKIKKTIYVWVTIVKHFDAGPAVYELDGEWVPLYRLNSLGVCAERHFPITNDLVKSDFIVPKEVSKEVESRAMELSGISQPIKADTLKHHQT